MFTVPTLFPRQFDDLFEAFDQLVADRWHHQTAVPVSVWSNDAAVAVTAEVPGVTADQLSIEATNDTLTISGVRKPTVETDGKATWLIAERSGDRFTRTITLPWRIDPDQVEARLSHGVLTIALRRADADRPRRVAITN